MRERFVVKPYNQDETVFFKEDDNNRVIFYTSRDLANFTKDENAFLEEIEKVSADLKLPKWWRTGDTLRFAHAVFLNVENTKAVLTKLLAHFQLFTVCSKSKGQSKTKPRNARIHRKRKSLYLWQMQARVHQRLHGL